MAKSKRLITTVFATLMAMLLVITGAIFSANTASAEQSDALIKVYKTTDYKTDGYGADGYIVFSSYGIYSDLYNMDDCAALELVTEQGAINRTTTAFNKYLSRDYNVSGGYTTAGYSLLKPDAPIVDFNCNGSFLKVEDRAANALQNSKHSLYIPGTEELSAPRFHNTWEQSNTWFSDGEFFHGGSFIFWVETQVDNEYVTLFINSGWGKEISEQLPVEISMWKYVTKIANQAKVSDGGVEYVCNPTTLAQVGGEQVGSTARLTSDGHFVTFKTDTAGKYYFLLDNPTFDMGATVPNADPTKKGTNDTSIRPMVNGVFFDSEEPVPGQGPQEVKKSIIYMLDGGTNGANPTEYVVGTGIASLANATKEGYTFDGWYGDSSFTTKVTSIPATADSDIVLYAKFTKITEPSPDTDKDVEEEKTEEKGGCGSVIGSTLALISLVSLGAGAVVISRKKEN